MSSFGAQHPDEGVLLRHLDGELPARQARQVREHLECCWQCRATAEELGRTVAECVRYRRNVLQQHLPAPPNPWTDLYREFDRIDAAEARGGVAERVMSAILAPFRRPWAIGAAAAALAAIFAFYQLRETPSVQAAALLTRAVAAADARPAGGPRQIRLRTTKQTFTRTAGRHAAETAAPAEAALARKFHEAHYDWDDPLSAKAFQDWRNGVGGKRDEVASAAGEWTIRTTADTGELERASLTLRQETFEPVGARLEFRDHEWVELTEITDASTRDGVPPAVTVLEPSVRPGEPSRPAAPLSGPAPVAAELHVVAALHGIGADLGDPLEIKVAGGKVLVSGVGVPAGRQQQIREALGRMPDVAVSFSEPAPATAPADAGGDNIAAGGGPPSTAQTSIEKALGGHAAFERLSARLLDRNEALMAQAYALRTLAQRFPAETEAGLEPDDRAILEGIAREHAADVAREAAEIRRMIEPVLTARSATEPPVSGQATWQAGAEELFQEARRVELLLSATLGVSADAAAGGERASAELRPALAELRARAEQLQKVLGR